MALTLKDAVLGERVVIGMTSNSMIAAQMLSGFPTIETTIVGRYNAYVLLGWRQNETASSCATYRAQAALRRKYPSMQFVPDVDDYDLFREVGGHCEIKKLPIQTVPIARAVKPSLPKEEWRNFANTIPGECPCGGTRGVCPYHP